jgi:hypothetical protein
MGQPAASTALPASRPAFSDILAGFGHAPSGADPDEGGLDALYCSHADGSLSAWRRVAGLLTYVPAGAARLVPPAARFAQGGAPALLGLAAGLWRGLLDDQGESCFCVWVVCVGGCVGGVGWGAGARDGAAAHAPCPKREGCSKAGQQPWAGLVRRRRWGRHIQHLPGPPSATAAGCDAVWRL